MSLGLAGRWVSREPVSMGGERSSPSMERGVDAQGPTDAAVAERDADPPHRRLLTLAMIEPTIGCRQYADWLADRGYTISKTTVQKHFVDHGLGRR